MVGSAHNGDFYIDLPSTWDKINIIKSYTIRYLEVPNIFANITTSNNVLNITANDNKTSSITIDSKYYTIDDLILELENGINAAITPNTVSVSVDNTKKITFAFSVSYTINIVSTIKNVIGLTAAITGSDITMQNQYNLSGETSLLIYSDTLKKKYAKEKNEFELMAAIPIDRPYGSMVYYKNSGSIYNEINYKNDSSAIRFIIKNWKNDILEIPVNYHFKMLLEIIYV